MKTNHHITAGIRPFDEAGVVSDAPDTPLSSTGGMLDITDKKAMEAELHEHRYHLQRNVEHRTAQLVRRIALLESCNATLSDKLASVQRELAALKQQPARNLPGAEQNDCSGQLYAMNNWTRNLIGTSVRDERVVHATAA
jgi:hypothetical protein